MILLYPPLVTILVINLLFLLFLYLSFTSCFEMNKSTQFPIDESHYDLLIIGPFISLCIIASLGAFQWLSKHKVEAKFVQSRLHRLPCLFLVLNVIVASCLVVDCLIIAIKGVLDQFNIPLSFIYYCTTSLFAWCANLVLLLNNNTGCPKISIIQCFFWVNTTCIDSIIEWLWIKDCLKHKQGRTTSNKRT